MQQTDAPPATLPEPLAKAALFALCWWLSDEFDPRLRPDWCVHLWRQLGERPRQQRELYTQALAELERLGFADSVRAQA